MPRSQANDRTFPLLAGATFTGTPESTAEHIAITVSVLVPTACTLTIEQSYNKATWLITEQYAITANVHKTVQQAVGLEYFRVKLTNDGIKQTFCHMITTLSSSLTQNVNIRSLESSRDSVTVDLSGAVIDVSGGTVEVTNFPAQQLVSGENSNYVFYPTAANNIPAIYADGTKGTDVAGGWQYTNALTGKINWYCYGSPSPATDYKVSQLTSMYTVINQQSTLPLAQAQNPWIMIYTRMDSGVNSGAFFKSKLFFGANAFTDISGVKLLYTGTDPVDIHPEITGINRIQLLFISALSDNKQLADVQNESILAGSLQTTNNTSPVGAFNFTMTEFGVDWVKTPAVLPIEFGRVMCDISGQAVRVSGTVATDISGQTVKVSSMPYLSKTTDSVDISGQTVVLGSGNNLVGKVLTFENPSSVISLTNISTVGQTIKASAGSLFNITVFNDGNAISYLKLYNVAVPTDLDTPVMTFPVLHDVTLNTISIHNYQFTTAIGVRATANYIANDTTAPNGSTSITAFYNGVLP
jgi:hypothetical protein